MSDDFATRISDGYAAEGAAIDVGRAMLDGTVHADAVVQIPTAMCTRHGLIAGATGTGKTVTLQLLAEQLSAQGVPVFAADIKGDLSGLAADATPKDKITERVAEMGLDYEPAAAPTQFWSLGGQGPGVPIRAAIGSFGPQLLAKVLGANETQRSSLSLVFHYADQQGLPLLDLVDLTDLLAYLVSDAGSAELDGIGGLAKSTAGVLLRQLVELGQQDAELFFGEPEIDITDLMTVDPDGRGVVSCLELAAVQDRPRLFSTFLMWLLAELFENLPEVGDLDKPKLVFFLDEAHLLFDDAPDGFVDQLAQTVRLIRSKGVGVFFVTQLPDDLPDAVLAQLGTRVQHGLRAFTPRDATALRSGRHDLSEDRGLRPGGGADTTRYRRGDRHHPRPEGCSDAGCMDQGASADLADRRSRGRRGHGDGRGQLALAALRRGDRPRVRTRAARGQDGRRAPRTDRRPAAPQ